MLKRAKSETVGKGDLLFLSAVLLLAAYGVLCVYSASSYNAQVQYGDATFFFRKQLVGFVIGAAAMVAISFLNYEKLRKWGLPALIVSLILLALVFVPGLGKSNYGATRWIGFGSFTIQPSEIAKLGFVMFTAGYFAKDPRADAVAQRLLARFGSRACDLPSHYSRTQYVGDHVCGCDHDRHAFSCWDLEKGARMYLYSSSARRTCTYSHGTVPPSAALGVHGPGGLPPRRRAISSFSLCTGFQTAIYSASDSSIPDRNTVFCPLPKAISFSP